MCLFSAAILTWAISGCAFGQIYPVNASADTGLPVDVAGTSAILKAPASVAVDGAGNLFFTDNRHVVLRLDAATGVVSLAAGNGTPGFSGDNGPATSAQLNAPVGIAVDSDGSLYIADVFNHRIRKVSDGIITTVAGSGTKGFSGDNGPAISAQLSSPWGIAVDAAGNLYIADASNIRIRKVSDGTITTVAGSGAQGFSGDNGPAASARLGLPCCVAVDSAGNLYIADYAFGSIRKVSNGVITTVVGASGVGGFSGDHGPAISAMITIPQGIAVDAAGDLYIADRANHRVRKISNGVISTIAGNGTPGFGGDNGPATSARLDSPSGVAVDAAGYLYIADRDNRRIRKVSNGVITTVAGSGPAGLSGDNAQAGR